MYRQGHDASECTLKKGFGNIVRKLNAQYDLPSREYFYHTPVPKLYVRIQQSK